MVRKNSLFDKTAKKKKYKDNNAKVQKEQKRTVLKRKDNKVKKLKMELIN